MMDGMYPYRPFTFASAPLEVSIRECRTVFYTPPVSASVARLEKEILALFTAFSYFVEAAIQGHHGKEEFLVTRRFSHLIELLIVDEANRLQERQLGEDVLLLKPLRAEFSTPSPHKLMIIRPTIVNAYTHFLFGSCPSLMWAAVAAGLIAQNDSLYYYFTSQGVVQSSQDIVADLRDVELESAYTLPWE